MRNTIRSALLAFGAALMLAGPVLAQGDAAKPAAPAGATLLAPAIVAAPGGRRAPEPQPDENNACARAASPATTRRSGAACASPASRPGIVNLPGAENGRADPGNDPVPRVAR